MNDAIDPTKKRLEEALAAIEAAATSAKEFQSRAEAAAKSFEQFDVRRIELMGVYQDRLNHEYDKGWEQIRIIAYVTAGILVAVGLLLRSAPISDPSLIIQAVCALGFLMTLGSLINQIGSQRDARDLRKTLGSLEGGVNPAYYTTRHRLFGITGAGILIISVFAMVFWVAAYLYGPRALRQKRDNAATGKVQPDDDVLTCSPKTSPAIS